MPPEAGWGAIIVSIAATVVSLFTAWNNRLLKRDEMAHAKERTEMKKDLTRATADVRSVKAHYEECCESKDRLREKLDHVEERLEECWEHHRKTDAELHKLRAECSGRDCVIHELKEVVQRLKEHRSTE